MSHSPLPSELEIQPLARPPRAWVTVPGSKSLTNRALVLAALSRAEPVCAVEGALRSEDTEVMVAALARLGFGVEVDWGRPVVRVRRPAGERVIPAAEADLFVGNSGTTMRFLTALAALGQGRYRLHGVPRMHERPIEDLLAALRGLGVRAASERGNGCPPVVIEADGIRGGRVSIRADVSSQFLSGLLMAAPRAQGPVELAVSGSLVSEPYIAMTVAAMRQFGARVETDAQGTFRVPAAQQFGVGHYGVEPDASAASYFWASAAVTGGVVGVRGLGRSSLQGDVAFVDALARMGCEVAEERDGLVVRGGRLRGIDMDMNAISDTVMTLAAVAVFAEGPTTIRNVAHIRHKETDRLAALAAELSKVGARVEETADGLRIEPPPAGAMRAARIATYQDHRMAMSLALVGLRVPGVVIEDPGCVGKTYPEFFRDLEALRV